MYAAEPIRLATLERMRRSFPPYVQFLQNYGQTEMETIIYLDHEGHNIRPESFGKPNIFCDVQIMKDNGGQARLGEIGEIGEIVVRCPSLMLAYSKNPKATKEFFRYGSDWGCTGDLGFMDEESFITLSGRKRDMYISGGENVYPMEIEGVLRQHPAVLEAAVLGVPDKKWGEVGAAAIVLKPGAQVTKEEIIEYCQTQLAKFKCPKHVKFFHFLPKNAVPKVVKGEIYPDLANLIKSDRNGAYLTK